MNKVARGIILGVPTLAVFVGVALYDGGQRATRLQDLAHDSLDLCESMAAQSGGSAERCITDFRAALDVSSSLGLKAALPMAFAAALVFFVLAAGLMYLVRRRRAETGPVADSAS